MAIAAYGNLANIESVLECARDEVSDPGSAPAASALREILEDSRYTSADGTARALFWITPSGPGMRAALYLEPTAGD